MSANLEKLSSELGFSSTWTESFLLYKLDVEEAEEPEIRLPTFVGSWWKQGVPEKNLLLLHQLH